jgi:hypothetical protein
LKNLLVQTKIDWNWFGIPVLIVRTVLGHPFYKATLLLQNKRGHPFYKATLLLLYKRGHAFYKATLLLQKVWFYKMRILYPQLIWEKFTGPNKDWLELVRNTSAHREDCFGGSGLIRGGQLHYLKSLESGKIDTHDRSLSWFGSGTSIKSGRVKLVF